MLPFVAAPQGQLGCAWLHWVQCTGISITFEHIMILKYGTVRLILLDRLTHSLTEK